jgi:tetratricopeptide (TPR) repeat protein
MTALRTQTLFRLAITVLLSAFILSGHSALAAGGSYGGPISAPSGGGSDPQQDLQKAVDYINTGEYKRAIRLLRDINKQVPKNADILNYLGYSYRKSGDQENGLKYYQKALDVNPNHPGANEYMGELYLEMNNLPKAEERLAVLSASCAGCPEVNTLRNSISAYKQAHPEPSPGS